MRNKDKWMHNIRCYWRTDNMEAVAEVADALIAAEERGEPSCIWHEVAVWAWDHRETVPCKICGGMDYKRRLGDRGVHELCYQRQKRGVSTPQMSVKFQCYCAKCE